MISINSISFDWKNKLALFAAHGRKKKQLSGITGQLLFSEKKA
jgi:hypothetical protein